MKQAQSKLLLFVLILFTTSNLGYSQGNSTKNIDYEVNIVYPPLSITKEDLSKANTIRDLNRYYKPSWIREFLSVEVLTSHKGKTKSAKSKSDLLSQEQKDNMKMADVDTDIIVNVKYIPENTLKQNDPKDFNFSFKIDPENQAEYSEGQQQLKKYLKDNVIDKIPAENFPDSTYKLAAITFSINEEGQIVDTKIFESSRDEEIDQLLVETIANMPCWEPAKYSNGIKVKQDFALTIGNHKSCVINMLNIRKYALPPED